MAIDIQFPKLYKWQDDVFQDIKEDGGKSLVYVCKARRQCGKSILAIVSLLYFAFRNSGSIGTCIEPVLHQSRRVYKQLLNAVGGEDSPLIKRANGTLLEIEFINGSQIIFKSAEQGQALRGMTVRNSILIIDEAAFIETEIFEILWPVVDATKSPVLIISTPLFLSGEFYDRYTEGINGSAFVKSYDWSRYDTSALLSPEKLEHYRQTMTPLKFRSEILGEFIAEGSYIFGDFTKCYGVSAKPPVYAAIDWSTGGSDKDDYTAMTLMDEDSKTVEIKFFQVFDPMDLVDNIASIIMATPTLKAVRLEVNSIGSVYLSALKRKIKKGLIDEFVTDNGSKRRIIEQLIQAFSKGSITIPDNPRLNKQLQHYAAEKTPGGKLTYNGADGVHDDGVMSLAMCYDLAMKPLSRFRIGFA